VFVQLDAHALASCGGGSPSGRACFGAADALREQGVAHVVFWEASAAPEALAVAHFSHAFFATLRNKSATVPEVQPRVFGKS
jgi:hypothetical protein